jgi:hypothetical protein
LWVQIYNSDFLLVGTKTQYHTCTVFRSWPLSERYSAVITGYSQAERLDKAFFTTFSPFTSRQITLPRSRPAFAGTELAP